MSSEKFSPVNRAAPSGIRRRLAVLVATGAGLGYSPVASGTVGSLWGIVLVLGLRGLPAWGQVVAAAILVLAAIPICHDAEAVFNRKDDGRIVADEFMTFPVCMIGLPADPYLIAVAFVTNRFFDIVKLPPAAQLQRIPGGIGIVLDDLAAATYSLAVNWAVYLLVLGSYSNV